MQTQSFTHTNPEEKPQKPRKKYEKPAVIYLAPLEAMAGLCIPDWVNVAYVCISAAGKNNSSQCVSYLVTS
jgi:hypothetical protein